MFLMQENPRGLQSFNGFSRQLQLAIGSPKKPRKVRDSYEPVPINMDQATAQVEKSVLLIFGP